MNLTAWAVVGLAVGLGQVPAAPAGKDAEPAGITLGAVRDIHPTRSRTQKLDIEYTKAERELGWSPKVEFATGLKETIDWYKANAAWIDGIKTKEYLSYRWQ